MKKLFILLVSVFFAFSINAQLIISEIVDGTGSGGYPKYVEVTNTGTSAIDLSAFKIRKSANGGGFSDVFTFPAFNLPAGESYVVTNIDNVTSGQLWTDFNLTAPTNVSYGVTNVNGNGDDAYALTDLTDNVIDIYGEELVDGTGSTWEYLDSYAYRNSTVVLPNTTFTQSEWTTAAPNTLDGQSADLSSYLTPGVHVFSSNDQTSTVTAPVTQLVAGTISSIGTDSVPVMRFDIKDAASGDNLPTVVTGVFLVAGPNNTLDFHNNLNGGGVYDLTNSAVVPVTGEPTVNADTAYLPISLTVPDGGTVSLEVYTYIDNTNAPDGAVLQFQINAASHGFTADGSGSDFESTLSGGDIVGNDFTVEVVATQNTWVVQPTDVLVNNAVSPAPQAAGTDVFGNVDVDYSNPVSVDYPGAGNMSLTEPITPVNGIATFSDMMFDTPYSGATITANDGILTNAISDPFNITQVVGGADCANAVLINVGTHTAAHSATDDYDQWFVFHAATDGTITAENCGSGYGGDTYLEIIEGSCSGTNFDMADNSCGNLETLSFPVVAGNDYYIAWGDYNTATPGTYDWTLSFTAAIPLTNAYAVSSTELNLQYASAMSSVNPADYTLTAIGQTTVNFSTATIDGTDPTIVHLTASSAIPANLIRDDINDAANNTSFQFYAGVLPVMYMNTANDPDTVIQAYNVTLRGVVTANDNFNQVWIQDSNNPMSGVLIYSSSFQGLVSVGDTVTITGQKTFYNGATEIENPVLINTVSGGTPTAALINTADIEYYKAEDDPSAEPWEGQLVTVNGIVIDSLGANYEYFGHSCNGDVICFDDDVDYHYGSGFTLTTGSMYNITGVVTFSYGHYKINPRGTADATEIVRDFTSVVEAPDTQVPDAVIDGTLAIDSLHAVEALKFKVTDAGGDGLPTKLSSFILYAGPNNTIDFTGDDLDGGWFDFGDASNPIQFAAEPVSVSDHITFAVDPETAVIDEGTSKEVILHLWFNSAIADESVFQAEVHADPHGFVADCMNSQFASTFASDVTGGTLTIDTNIGIDAINGKNIKVYPNPSNGIININVENNFNLEVSDITGRIISTKSLTGNTSIQINTSGVYFLKFSDEHGTYIQKVIIQ